MVALLFQNLKTNCILCLFHCFVKNLKGFVINILNFVLDKVYNSEDLSGD